MIFIQSTTVDIPEANQDESKTFDMGFLHTILGTGDIYLWLSNNINENSFQVLFFIVCVLVEIFANVSGISLIYLLWRTDFLFTHAIYIVGCKVGRKRTINHIKQVLSIKVHEYINKLGF